MPFKLEAMCTSHRKKLKMKLQKKTQHQASIEQQRSGFTLIELLVVIAVIGILMALLLPAIQSARESGRKTACMSNAYQLGMAVNRFDQDKGKVPGWRQALSGRNVSWPIICLPYLERNDLFNEWNGGAANPSGGLVGRSCASSTRRVCPLARVSRCCSKCARTACGIATGLPEVRSINTWTKNPLALEVSSLGIKTAVS